MCRAFPGRSFTKLHIKRVLGNRNRTNLLYWAKLTSVNGHLLLNINGDNSTFSFSTRHQNSSISLITYLPFCICALAKCPTWASTRKFHHASTVGFASAFPCRSLDQQEWGWWLRSKYTSVVTEQPVRWSFDGLRRQISETGSSGISWWDGRVLLIQVV